MKAKSDYRKKRDTDDNDGDKFGKLNSCFTPSLQPTTFVVFFVVMSFVVISYIKS